MSEDAVRLCQTAASFCHRMQDLVRPQSTSKTMPELQSFLFAAGIESRELSLTLERYICDLCDITNDSRHCTAAVIFA